MNYREMIDEQNESLFKDLSEYRRYEALQSQTKNNYGDRPCPKPPQPPQQTHTHEFESSTKLAEEGDDRHNHRFAGVTSEVIPLPGGNHKHAIFTLTDYFGHLHEVAVETEPARDVGFGKHVHFVKGNTTLNDGHFHEFAFATLIEAPLLPNT